MATARNQPVWMLDELSHAGRENLDSAHVERYDDKEDADSAAEVRVLQSLGLNDASTVIDIGAGTGQFTLRVAPLCRQVFAVDVSSVMLARLDRKLRAANVTNVESVLTGILAYEHIGNPVDFAYSRYALHHLPDFWKAMALAKINRIMRPGGILRLWDVIYSFDLDESTDWIERWCATGIDSVENKWTRAELEEHIRDEHSTFSWLLEPMIKQAGFAFEEVNYSDDKIMAKYVLRKSDNGSDR